MNMHDFETLRETVNLVSNAHGIDDYETGGSVRKRCHSIREPAASCFLIKPAPQLLERLPLGSRERRVELVPEQGSGTHMDTAWMLSQTPREGRLASTDAPG